MKQIASFFTLYWIIYFPTCIAYYNEGGMQWIDEFMTVVIFSYTLTKASHRSVTKSAWKEYTTFVAIWIFYLLYGFAFGENVFDSVWRDALQWLRPFSVLFCTWVLNPRLSEKQKKYIIWAMLGTMGLWIVQHPSTVSSADVESVTIGQMAICTGMMWYLFKEDTKKNRYIALGIVLVGLAAPKFKFMGEVVAFVGLFFFVKKKLKLKSPKTFFNIAIIVGAMLFVTWTRFDTYYVSGMDNDNLARPMTYKTGWKILFDYFPFGSGFGSFGTAAAADFYSPLYYKYELNHVWGLTPSDPQFLADAFYPTLAEVGFLGTVLFFMFWLKKIKQIEKIKDMRYYRVAMMSFFCLAIEQTADSSFLSGKGMGYCMLIGLCLNANRNFIPNNNNAENTELPQTPKKPIRMRTTFGLRHRRHSHHGK